MANRKITELNALTGANATDTDVFAIVDVSADETKKITLGELKEAFDSGSGFVRITGDTMTGDLTVPNVIVSGNVDGRDVSADGTKLDGIEAGADVTDTANVTAAGAAMETGADFTGNVTFGDNDKAIFGAGSDLQIYHDGNHSYISDQGTGRLYLRASNDLFITDAAGAKNKAIFTTNGAVDLFHDGVKKLATTSTGVDITGTLTSDGLTVDTGANSFNALQIQASSVTGGTYGLGIGSGSDFTIYANGTSNKLIKATAFGDISFYEDTGTTPKFFWDASAESLGIGTDSPSPTGVGIDIDGDQTSLRLSDSAKSTYAEIFANNGTLILKADAANAFATSNMIFQIDTAEAMRIDSSGNVKISNGTLQIERSGSSPLLQFTDTGVNSRWMGLVDGTSNFAIYGTNGLTQELTLDASGNLLVGKTSDNNSLEGISLAATGAVKATNANDLTGIFNRLTTDGDIVQFWKDGTTVGSIGVVSGTSEYLTVGNADTGLLFHDGVDRIYPWNMSTNAPRDNAIDLGTSSTRFKDLYLSGGVVFGSTGGSVTSKTLDDYEEGTWTPTLGGTATYSALQANYVKVGSLVQVKATILVNAIGTGSATTITGLPYTNGDGIAALNIAVMTNSATSVVHVASSISANSSQITMRAMAAAAASYSVTNIFGSGTYIEMSGSYSTIT